MIAPRPDWRTLLALPALAIVFGTIFYSQYLVKKISKEERQKVEQWVAASRDILSNRTGDLTLASLIHNEQQTIPIIETNEQDSITNFINLDSSSVSGDPGYLTRKLALFKSENPPVEMKLSEHPYQANRYYYGHTLLLDQVRYFPLVQLLLVALFVFFVLYSISLRNRSTQNQVWAGMAKETAHQLGTPISSLEGWVEMLRENPANAPLLVELQKDIDRLKLVSDRFGKIGSSPQLEPTDLVSQLTAVVEYMRKRSPYKVQITLDAQGKTSLMVLLNKPLFDWVMENLLKNALDAMDGKGKIQVLLQAEGPQVTIDVTDTGKGIAPAYLSKVFKPGFTTKKRGWGLGLTLSKRIIEQYHRGQLFVKHSEPGRGTTFRIVLRN